MLNGTVTAHYNEVNPHHQKLPMTSAPDLADYADALAVANPSGGASDFLVELTDLLADELAETLPALTTPQPRSLAARLVAQLARHLGGGSFCIPKGLDLQRALRAARLWADYDGTVDGAHGIRALARREGLTESAVYRLLAAQRQQRRRDTQPDLFPVALDAEPPPAAAPRPA